ncbi:unnamed protein product [Schistosoma margrebowiei]|uniref:Calponin-homology (CH) domain-containing protein n=1 Tax=Schistosoma margrebowiei TaxID=48269 RepID=A0AA84Z732_9TREM|nr:unnamed protein product [Schistosoma margrebowiei]
MEDNFSQCLLNWCIEQTKTYPHINITDFTSSWKDGLAFCALIHKHFPDLIDFSHLKSEDAVTNLKLAFFVAETKLNIPVPTRPQVIVLEDVNEKIIFEYVSKLYGALSRNSGQLGSNKLSDKNLSYLCEQEEGLLICDLCGETIFRVEQLTVFSRNYHRSCFRDNQLTYLKERNKTLKGSNCSDGPPLTKFSVADPFPIRFSPQKELNTVSNGKSQPTCKPPSRPPLPDVLSNNASPELNSVLKIKAKISADIEQRKNNSNSKHHNIVSYPAALNPFEDDSLRDPNSQYECTYKPYNPFDDDLSALDSEEINNISDSEHSDILSMSNPPSLVSTPSNHINKYMEQSSQNFSMEKLVADESVNLRTAHSSIYDLSSLLAYGSLNKAQSSSLSSDAKQSSKSPLNGSNAKISRSVNTKGPAPPIPVLCRRDVRRDQQSDFIPYTELHRQLYDINNELSNLELSARKIQTSIREMSENNESVKRLLKKWLHTVELKDNLFKKESELLQRLRCQELEDRHADLEYELRTLLAKQDILKTKEEKAREEELIADLLYVVDKRAELSESTGDFKPKHRARSSSRRTLESKFKQICLSLRHASLSQTNLSTIRDKSLKKVRKLRASTISRLKNKTIFR